MATVSFSMPDELIEQLDKFVDDHDYPGRSAVIREATRTLFEELAETDLENRELIGLVTVVFKYETMNVEERLMDLRHEYDDLTSANLHSHVGNRYCMELFVLEGDLDAISAFVETVRAMKNTLSVSHSVIPLDEL